MMQCCAWFSRWEEGILAEIGEQHIFHKNKNIYRETETPEVALSWADGRRLTVKWQGTPEAPLAMTALSFLGINRPFRITPY